MEPLHQQPTPNPPPQPAPPPAAEPNHTPSMHPAPAMRPVGAAPQAKAKADLGKRFVAHIIDAVLAYVVGLIPFIGGIIGAAYFVVRDGLELEFMDGRSIGKKVMKLRPVRLDGQKMDLETSFKRNWMWGIGAIISLLLYIPIVGWLLILPVALIALGIGLFEVYKVFTDDEGRRWGDNMAGTKVIEVAD